MSHVFTMSHHAQLPRDDNVRGEENLPLRALLTRNVCNPVSRLTRKVTQKDVEPAEAGDSAK